MGCSNNCILPCILVSILVAIIMAEPKENISAKAKRSPQMPDMPPPPTMPNGFPHPIKSLRRSARQALPDEPSALALMVPAGSLHRATRQAPPDEPPPPAPLDAPAASSHRATRQAPPEDTPAPPLTAPTGSLHRAVRQAPPEIPQPPAEFTRTRATRQAPPDEPPPPAMKVSSPSNTNDFASTTVQNHRQMRSASDAAFHGNPESGLNRKLQLSLRTKREARGTGGRLSSRTG
ncbi:uncharacterized protein LOC129723311 isoform X2 [Wyeomyia smithii]|uniref:uncharacterized protein LOC129723311 isoform X2 n=1 Tax=Wyeomyia smithii TaxID=174621 RepID=UPI002467F3D5|nr:uncharacterized protein LOC129723311 isoform X2 [Wyeomyia smithii]